jgi:hypothetical protein
MNPSQFFRRHCKLAVTQSGDCHVKLSEPALLDNPALVAFGAIVFMLPKGNSYEREKNADLWAI